MQDKFQRPVDLKEKMNKQNIIEQEKLEKSRRIDKATLKKNEMIQSKGAIDEMFSNSNKDGENNLHKIERGNKGIDIPYAKIVILILSIIIVLGGWWFLANKDKQTPIVKETKKEAWSAVMLISGEVYYGLVGEIDKNPIVINNVYYDYDQVNSRTDAGEKKETGSLRLVKRGKENYGPDGTMTIFQPQIKYIEALKDDSKVLKAILEHEGK